MDTLVSMRAFLRVVELGSFAAAARALQLSPAMVTHHLAHLEKRVGTRLLNRSTRRVAATDAGRAYYERCAEALAAIDEAETLAASESLEARGTLRITAPVEFGNLHLASLVGDFMRAQAQVNVVVDLSNRVVDLIDEGFDVALRIATTLDSGLVARQLARSRLMMVAAPSYVARSGVPAHPAGLAAAAALVFAVPGPRTAIAFERDGTTVDVKLSPKISSTSSETLRQLACAGFGVCMLPTFVAGTDVASGRLVDLYPGWRIGELAISVVYANRKLLPLRVRTFIEFLVERFGPNPLRDPWAPIGGFP